MKPYQPDITIWLSLPEALLIPPGPGCHSQFVDIDLSLSLSLQDFTAKLWSLSIKRTASDMNLVVMIFLSLYMLLCKLAV